MWATQFIELLKKGKTVVMYPRGNSMVPRIKSGQRCVVAPLKDGEPVKNDVVLCKVNGNQYLHKVLAVRGNSFQIGNNKGRVNGWISRNSIFGKLIQVGR